MNTSQKSWTSFRIAPLPIPIQHSLDLRAPLPSEIFNDSLLPCTTNTPRRCTQPTVVSSYFRTRRTTHGQRIPLARRTRQGCRHTPHGLFERTTRTHTSQHRNHKTAVILPNLREVINEWGKYRRANGLELRNM